MHKTKFFFSLLFISVIFSSPAKAEAIEALARNCFDMNAEACATFHYTNRERAKYRLPLFQYLPRAHDMAQEQSEDMASRNYFDHERPATRKNRGESFSQRAARFGLSYGVGENIAQTQSAKQAVQMWMKSPGHRRNILNKKFRYLAVGYRDGMYTQVFVN